MRRRVLEVEVEFNVHVTVVVLVVVVACHHRTRVRSIIASVGAEEVSVKRGTRRRRRESLGEG
jgi:hypothetical protein